ncbi:MAG: hypothetical protein Q7S00_05050 [bacterium]|nr:hypothetical protein [bacterium]
MTQDKALFGSSFPGIIDLKRLKKLHRPLYETQERVQMDGNGTAALASLQFWRSPLYPGFPITPSTKWLEMISAYVNAGKFLVEENGKKFSTKRVKLLEAEHAVADYLVGAAAACRELIMMTATSSVGLDHMTEVTRSIGASGLGNIMMINVYRATANYPLCIEGDPSDTLAHRDDGWIQVSCRGKQQIYDTLIQLPCVGMHPDIMIPTMPGYYGIKDSHRSETFFAEPDEKIHDFQDALIPEKCPLPSLIDGETSMGNCVTSAHFQGFKWEQKQRLNRVIPLFQKVGQEFEKKFGRPGLVPFETYFMEDSPTQVLLTMGPDAGTAYEVIRSRRKGGERIGLIVARLLTPFPSALLREALKGVELVGVVNNAFQTERGHLTTLVAESLSGLPIKTVGFFAGVGGADISVASWEKILKILPKQPADQSPFIHQGEVL